MIFQMFQNIVEFVKIYLARFILSLKTWLINLNQKFNQFTNLSLSKASQFPITLVQIIPLKFVIC